jgi:hypothetical protein
MMSVSITIQSIAAEKMLMSEIKTNHRAVIGKDSFDDLTPLVYAT